MRAHTSIPTQADLIHGAPSGAAARAEADEAHPRRSHRLSSPATNQGWLPETVVVAASCMTSPRVKERVGRAHQPCVPVDDDVQPVARGTLRRNHLAALNGNTNTIGSSRSGCCLPGVRNRFKPPKIEGTAQAPLKAQRRAGGCVSAGLACAFTSSSMGMSRCSCGRTEEWRGSGLLRLPAAHTRKRTAQTRTPSGHAPVLALSHAGRQPTAAAQALT
jgi:hypothetical protein